MLSQILTNNYSINQNHKIYINDYLCTFKKQLLDNAKKELKSICKREKKHRYLK